VPFILPILPLVAWFMCPDRWRPLLGAAYLIATLVFLVVFWRSIQRELAALRGFGPANYAGEWLPGWTAKIFQSHFNALLERSGWRVLATDSMGENRVVSVLRKDRHIATVLALRPGAPVTAEDLAFLAKHRRQAGAARACVVSTDHKDLPAAWTTAEPETAYLRYKDFADLNAVLGFGD